jgi:hypothetical protein
MVQECVNSRELVGFSGISKPVDPEKVSKEVKEDRFKNKCQ